jgi:heat shock protein HtpX
MFINLIYLVLIPMILNQIKTVLLLTLLTVFVLIMGFVLGGESGLTIAFVFVILFNIFSYWFSDKLILKINGAKLATYSVYTKLNDIVKEISERAGIKKPKIYIIDKNFPNAFATGRSPSKSAIAVTEGLLELLSERELKGVIAHEISHIKNRDTLISTIAVILTGVISYIAILARWGMIFGSKDGDSSGLFEILILTILAPFIATILRFAISRTREYIADESGAKIIKDPLALASALKKLENYPDKPKKGNQAIASMYIVNPFASSKLLKIFSTHPTTVNRIKKLRKIDLNL